MLVTKPELRSATARTFSGRRRCPLVESTILTHTLCTRNNIKNGSTATFLSITKIISCRCCGVPECSPGFVTSVSPANQNHQYVVQIFTKCLIYVNCLKRPLVETAPAVQQLFSTVRVLAVNQVGGDSSPKWRLHQMMSCEYIRVSGSEKQQRIDARDVSRWPKLVVRRMMWSLLWMGAHLCILFLNIDGE